MVTLHMQQKIGTGIDATDFTCPHFLSKLTNMAAAIGVPRSELIDVFKGRKPNIDQILAIAKFFPDVPLIWFFEAACGFRAQERFAA